MSPLLQNPREGYEGDPSISARLLFIVCRSLFFWTLVVLCFFFSFLSETLREKRNTMNVIWVAYYSTHNLLFVGKSFLGQCAALRCSESTTTNIKKKNYLWRIYISYWKFYTSPHLHFTTLNELWGLYSIVIGLHHIIAHALVNQLLEHRILYCCIRFKNSHI